MNEEDSVAQHFASSSELIFLQEIPPGDHGTYRLKQLARAMNGTVNSSSSSIENRFNYLLGRETVVLDKTSQLNAIIYPASWKVIQQASLTSFLHPPVIAWFKTPEPLGSTVLAACFHFTINWSRFYCQQDHGTDQIAFAAEQDCRDSSKLGRESKCPLA